MPSSRLRISAFPMKPGWCRRIVPPICSTNTPRAPPRAHVEAEMHAEFRALREEIRALRTELARQL
jgi:hypothetical protein